MTDQFDKEPVRLDDPVSNASAVTPSNGADLAFDTVPRALWIGGTGDVKVDMVGVGEGIIFAGVPIGFLPARVTKVYATGTTATKILAVW